MSGYPISRTLDGIVQWRDLDTVIVVESDSLEPGAAVALDSGLDDEAMKFVVTPYSTVVTKSLFGSFDVGSNLTFTLAGGIVDGVKVTATEELAPSSEKLSRSAQLVIGGQLKETKELGLVLDPQFIYSVDPSGKLVSLLESGSSDTYPSFTMTELIDGLAARK